jgi:hypothetical protein
MQICAIDNSKGGRGDATIQYQIPNQTLPQIIYNSYCIPIQQVKNKMKKLISIEL